MGDLLCGYDLGDGYTCAIPAEQIHTHDDAVIAKGIDQTIRRDMAEAYTQSDGELAATQALLNQADQMVPARGLAETLTRESRPLPGQWVHFEGSNPTRVDHRTAGPFPEGHNWHRHTDCTPDRCGSTPEQSLREGRPVKVDFREMLGDDTRAWTTRSRLVAVLDRQYLATTLVDQLDPETSAMLADRLETLVSQAVSETTNAINQHAAHMVSERIVRLREDMDETRARLRDEVNRERFDGHSRLD